MNTEEKFAKLALPSVPGMAVQTGVKCGECRGVMDEDGYEELVCGQLPRHLKQRWEDVFMLVDGSPTHDSARYVAEHPGEVRDLAKWYLDNLPPDW